MDSLTKTTLQAVSDSTIDEPVPITVIVNPVNSFHKLIMRWGIVKRKKTFVLQPIFLGTLIKISKVLLSLEIHKEEFDENPARTNFSALHNHTDSLAMIIALAIRNNSRGPSPGLVRFIKNNLTSREMLYVFGIVLKKMDMTSFMTSIISAGGLNVLVKPDRAPAKPVNGEEVSL